MRDSRDCWQSFCCFLPVILIDYITCTLFSLIRYNSVSALARPNTAYPSLPCSSYPILKGQIKHWRQVLSNGPISNWHNLLLNFKRSTFFLSPHWSPHLDQLRTSSHKTASLSSFRFLLKIYCCSDVHQELTTAKCWSCGLAHSSLPSCRLIFSPLLLQ